MPIPYTLGDHIKKRRFELKRTQIEISRILGVSECTITNWEKNYTQPRLHLMPRVIDFLGYAPSTNKEPQTLGERLVKYRKNHGMSQKELARRIQIDPATLSRLERNQGERSHTVSNEAINFLKTVKG